MSWRQLQDIMAQNRQLQQTDQQQPPVACPIDGAILEVGRDGQVRNCPLGNYRWSGGPVVIGS